LGGQDEEDRDLTPKSLVKLSGVALLLSGILAIVGFSVHPHDSASSNHGIWLGAHVLVMSGGLLNLLGLVGLYLVSAAQLGSTGLFGFLFAAVSLVLYLGKLYWSAFIYPLVMARDAEFIRSYGFTPGSDPVDPIVRIVFYLGPILFAIGYALLGLGLLKAKAYPTPALWALIVGALLVGLWPLLPGVLQSLSAVVSVIYTAGIGWIGYLLARKRDVFA
jgi:hypothetical protein